MVMELGPSIGSYRERDIPAYVVDRDVRYEFDRVALEDRDGGVSLSQLADNECVIVPGLIYREASN
jgi:hypothetical protein